MSTLDQSIGALEIGILLSSVLYGILTVQAFLYTQTQSKDPMYVRITVSKQVFSPRFIFHSHSCHLGWMYLVGEAFYIESVSCLTFHVQDLRDRSYRFRLDPAVHSDGHELREHCCKRRRLGL
jgi:hypothetical protein